MISPSYRQEFLSQWLSVEDSFLCCCIVWATPLQLRGLTCHKGAHRLCRAETLAVSGRLAGPAGGVPSKQQHVCVLRRERDREHWCGKPTEKSFVTSYPREDLRGRESHWPSERMRLLEICVIWVTFRSSKLELVCFQLPPLSRSLWNELSKSFEILRSGFFRVDCPSSYL